MADQTNGRDGVGSQEEEEMETESSVYMACISQGHRLGIAYYDNSTGGMHVTETWDSTEGSGDEYPYIQLLKYQTLPALIYTSTKMDDAFVRALQKRVMEDGRDFQVKLVKSSAFSYEQAKHRLTFLHVRGMPENADGKERLHLLNSMINLESDMQVRAAGALVAILQEEMILDSLDQDAGVDSRVTLGSITEISLDGYLTLDAATHDALQIFQEDRHPSSMGIGKAKEGFSVFGMMNKCNTMMGRRMLKLWFMRPLVDLELLEDRLDTISFLMSSQDLVKALKDSLKKIKDVPKILQRFGCAGARSTAKDWSQFLESLANVVHIRGLLELIISQRQQDAAAILELQVVRKIFKYVSEELTQVCELVREVIDFDQTCGESVETIVAYGICEELDDLKHQYEGLPDFLNQVAEAELNRIPPGALQHCNYTEASILHIPQVGYLMRFEGDKQGQALTDALPDFEFEFEGDDADGHGIFYHTKRTHEVDELLGDVYHKILDMENAILRDLEKRVVDSSTTLVQAVDAAAELDCLLSLSIAAREYNYSRPLLTRENVLVIRNGRHVLQEMTVDTFVPNDTEIEATGRINVITGPNYSGKSVYVKQVALITFLAHIGSFVPADECTIGLTDRIFTRIASRETMAVAQSTFMIDLNQVSVMLRHATARSLCIIDEFGKGTLTADGVGLMCATLKQLASLKAPPKVLVCTHFGEVLDETFLPRSKNVQFSTMSILTEQQPGAQSDGNTRDLQKDITFLYRLVKGHAVPSYGVHCAELAGVAPDVLKRASEIIQFIKEGKPIDRLQGSKTLEKDLEYKALVEKLLAFDCQNGDPKEFLKQIFAPASNVEATASEP